MALYQVDHICHLTEDQQDKLAASIIRIHTEKFTTPAILVNVTFTNTSSQRTYIAGHRQSTNRILAHVRHGPSCTRADYNDLCLSIQQAWDDMFADSLAYEYTDPFAELKTIFVLGGIMAGREIGLAIPPAGEDKQWLQDNIEALAERAEEEDQGYVELMNDLRSREDMEGVDETDGN